MHVGKFEFGSHIDVTDPCYDADVRGGRFTVEAKPGTYNCFVGINREDRVIGIQIQHVGCWGVGQWAEIGEIGVDAGLAGFFNDKPDYQKEGRWVDVCRSIDDDEMTGVKYFFNKDGFFSHSGYGDGSYKVYARKDKKGQIVGLQIMFIDDWDDEDES